MTHDARQAAYAAFDRGQLDEAAPRFAALAQAEPGDAELHYMAGLAAKYRGDWDASLQANLTAIGIAPSEGARWNAAIAATAIHDHAQARAQWQALGIAVPGEQGPIEGDFGVVRLRLNPSGGSEAVYARRVGPVTARLLNVPLPESGFRHGDLVLHDGARLVLHEHHGHRYPVFNVLARLRPSEHRTFVVFLQARDPAALQPVLLAELAGLAAVEDWTEMDVLCLRCSYGVAHSHAERNAARGWKRDRVLGVAATSRAVVDRLFAGWASRWRGRRLDSVETRDHPLPARAEGQCWWLAPDDTNH